MADLRDSIAAAIDAVDVDKEIPDEPVVVASEEVVPVESAPVEQSTDTSPTEPVVPSEVAVETPTSEVTTPATTATPELPPAPASWKDDAKQVWADLPEAARNEVIRRETHVNRVLAENAEVRNYAGAIQQVASRHQQRIAEWGVPLPQVLDTMLEADRILQTAKPVQRAQYMAKLIKDYGIDITALDNALSGVTPAVPDVSRQVQIQVDAALAPFRQQQQLEMEAQQQVVADTIASMENNAQYPLFEQIRDEMADLIEIKAARGIYISLPEAYNMCVGVNSNSQQQLDTVKQDNATAQKAKQAAVSVSGTPVSSNVGINPQDLRATISNALDGNRVS